MDTKKNNDSSLEKIPANRRMIDELLSHGLITYDARNYAMTLLYRPQDWGIWVSSLLLVLGLSLILSGIVYFFAFNWTKITPEMKLGSIQLAILGCLGTSYFYGLGRFFGKIMLVSASVLVGVFLAVFGQIYQTGADAYNLFMMWALFILPWVILSEFAALWLVWLVITNVFLVLYWDQAVLPELESAMMIVSYLAIFNATFLWLREFFVSQGKKWLQDRWTRVMLVITILGYVLIPTIALIIEPSRATYAIVFGAVLSAIIHGVFYFVYRHKIPDMSGLAGTILSGCIILESAIFKALTEVFRYNNNAIMYLLMSCITLGVFTLAIIKLRTVAKEMEANNV
jgi:uncharacterized membrane protein